MYQTVLRCAFEFEPRRKSSASRRDYRKFEQNSKTSATDRDGKVENKHEKGNPSVARDRAGIRGVLR
jgi:hypothetical protein